MRLLTILTSRNSFHFQTPIETSLSKDRTPLLGVLVAYRGTLFFSRFVFQLLFIYLLAIRVLVSFFFPSQILVIWFFPSPSRNRYFSCGLPKKRVNKKFSALRAKRSVHFASKRDDVGW